MNLDAVRRIADAVLYEGYILYPYRASAQKNRSRWQWGVVMGPGYAAADPSERDFTQAEIVLEHSGQRLPDQRLVVNNQNVRGLHERISAAGISAVLASASAPFRTGRSTTKRAPAGTLSSTRMVASWSARIRFTIARPRPVPRPLVEK